MLASALDGVVTTRDFDSLSCVAAVSVRSVKWGDAGAKLLGQRDATQLYYTDGVRNCDPMATAVLSDALE